MAFLAVCPCTDLELDAYLRNASRAITVTGGQQIFTPYWRCQVRPRRLGISSLLTLFGVTPLYAQPSIWGGHIRCEFTVRGKVYAAGQCEFMREGAMQSSTFEGLNLPFSTRSLLTCASSMFWYRLWGPGQELETCGDHELAGNG